MRLLLASNIENWTSTGMGNWSHQIAHALRELGHDVSLWFANDFERVRRTGRGSVLLFPAALAARIASVRPRFDAVVVHEPSGFWCGVGRSLGLLPPLVVMCHNVESKCFEQLRRGAGRGERTLSWGSRVKGPLFRLWQSDGAIRLADHVLCLSREDEEYVQRRLSVAPDHVTPFINGVAPQFFDTSRVRQAWRNALFVGGWLEVKGSNVLPALWSQVSTVIPNARLSLVGTGSSEADVLQHFSVEVRRSIRVVPHVEASAMVDEYARHDLLLMPSWNEGSPLALLEAMAAGLAVVATRTGGIPDIVSSGTDGLLFEVGNASEGAQHVLSLFKDAGFARSVAQSAQRRARDLTWQAAARTVAEASSRAVKRRRRSWINRLFEAAP